MRRKAPRQPAAPSAATNEDPGPATATPKVAHDLGAELQARAAAQRLLPTEPRRALRLLGQHRERFPDSALAEEREVLRVEALSRAGRKREAVAAARALLGASPRGPYAARLRRILRAP